jgi:hypothetical protein
MRPKASHTLQWQALAAAEAVQELLDGYHRPPLEFRMGVEPFGNLLFRTEEVVHASTAS